MNKKEKIRVANQIAKAELIIQKNENNIEVQEAKQKVLDLTNKIDFEDLLEIDLLIQAILNDSQTL